MTLKPLFMFLLLASALALAACGGPDPIVVYVTVTPSAEPVTNESTANDITLVGQPAAQQPTPQPTVPGVQYGPITGPNYTPEPRYTPLPDTVSTRGCQARVIVPQVSLFQSPDTTSAALGTAADREILTVNQLSGQWASTDRGWLALNDSSARLIESRACEALRTGQPLSTTLGLHVLNGTSVDFVLNFVRRMVQAGHPVGTIKGLNGTEEMINEIERISPQTVTVYRSLLQNDGFGDCPSNVRDRPDPAATARRWYDSLQPYWSQVNADFFEYVNECPVALDWTVDFSIEMMKIANENQRCLLLFSLSGGTPDMQEFSQVLPAYQYALDHECQPGRTHGIALHAYSMEDNRLLSETDVWLALRHRIMFERLQVTLPPAIKLPVYITEAGIGGGTVLPPCEIIIRDALQYTYQLEDDPYVDGFHLWSVGSGTDWYDITACLPQLSDALIVYYEGAE